MKESRDARVNERELVKPSSVRIKREVSENEAETDEIRTDEVGKSKTNSDSSVDLRDHLDIRSYGESDGDDPKCPPKRSGGSGNNGHDASSISRLDNTSKRSSQSGNGFRATPTSLSDSATPKTLESSSTHLNGSNTPPANPYQSPPIQVEEPRRSTRNRRAPARDDNDRYFLISYMNRAGQNMGGGGGAEGGTARDNERSERCDTSNRCD